MATFKITSEIMAEDNVKCNLVKVMCCDVYYHLQLKEKSINLCDCCSIKETEKNVCVSVQTVYDPECTTPNGHLKTNQIWLIWLHEAFPHQDFLARKVLTDQWLMYIKETAHVAFLVWRVIVQMEDD